MKLKPGDAVRLVRKGIMHECIVGVYAECNDCPLHNRKTYTVIRVNEYNHVLVKGSPLACNRYSLYKHWADGVFELVYEWEDL